MKSVVTYVRNLLGWSDETPVNRPNFKRDRADEEFLSDDDTPAFKRPKQLLKSRFPSTMSSNSSATNGWEKKEMLGKVRHVPIQVERAQPSTSTPLDTTDNLGRRVRTVPIQLLGYRDKSSTPGRKTVIHKTKPVMHVVDDDDSSSSSSEVAIIETKKAGTNRKPKYFVNLEDYENIEDYKTNSKHSREDDVIFVKKISAPPPMKPYKFFIAEDQDGSDEPVYYKFKRKVNDRNSMSPKVNKFIAPPGITKSYKKPPAPVSSWLRGTGPSRNKYLGFNGNSRATLAEVFNLDEKKNYRELIKQVAGSIKPAAFGRPLEVIDLADEYASFRNTQQSQKKALQEINLVERGLKADQENSSMKEYDPITVASINSSDSEVEVVPSETSTSSSVRIDRINSLKDSYRDNAVTAEDWLAKIDNKYRKKKLESQALVNEARRESDIISKVNSEQKIAQLEQRLKYELSIPESLFEEPQPTVELPTLTPAQIKLVNKALGPGPSGQLLVEKFNLRIHRRDLQTLSGLNWLNDEVINFYMNLIMQRSAAKPALPRVYATNTFFYPKLMQAGQAGLRRWTRKVDIFTHDLMIVPVHLGVHWCVSIIDFRAKTVSYLDSMGGRNQPCLDALMQYLRDEHNDKKGQPFDEDGWTAKCLKDIPQQMNGSDCGVFACTFAEFAARDAPYTFTQAHMPLLRRKAALEILTGELLL